MTKHTDRAEERAEHSDPENFTCGKCKKVFPFVDKDLKCPECDKEEE